MSGFGTGIYKVVESYSTTESEGSVSLIKDSNGKSYIQLSGGSRVKITDENFEELVIKSDKLVIVDFWAEWCGPCKAIAPILDEICDQFGDKVVVGKVNVDEVKQTPVKYGIRSIPTLLFFSNGEIVKQEVGLQSEQTLIDNVNQIIS